MPPSGSVRRTSLETGQGARKRPGMTKRSPFRYFKTSPKIIRLAVMLYVRFPLSLRNVEDLLHERGIDISHETVRFWWHRFGPLFTNEIRRRKIERMKSSRWQWHLDKVFVKINGERHYLWRAVDHEGEVLESFVTKTRDKKAALKFLKKAMRKHGQPEIIVTDRLRSYSAALKEIDAGKRQERGALAQQPSREFTPAVSKARASDAPISPNTNAPEVRRSPRLSLEPLQSGTSPLISPRIQA